MCCPGRREEQEVQRRGAGCTAVLGLFPKDFCSWGGHNQPPAQDHHPPPNGHQQQLNLLLQALKPTWTHLPSRNEAPLGRPLWMGNVEVALGSSQPSLCRVLLLTNPPCSTREQVLVQRAFSRHFPLLLGRRDIWLVLQQGQGMVSQALKKLRLPDLNTSRAPHPT